MPYTTNKTDLPEGFIDLAEKIGDEAGFSRSMPQIAIDISQDTPKVEYHYPSLYFSDAKGLENLPENGTALISFKKIMERKEKMIRDGKETQCYCVELQINGIKLDEMMPETEEEDDEDEIEEGLKKAEKEIEEED